jgi:hypothetical protein
MKAKELENRSNVNKRVYISGKISGLKEFEAKELFYKAENYIVYDLCHECVNPMTINHDHNKSWESYMKENLKAMFYCQIIAMLPNWTESRGARIELNLAIELGLEVIFLDV